MSCVRLSVGGVYGGCTPAADLAPVQPESLRSFRICHVNLTFTFALVSTLELSSFLLAALYRCVSLTRAHAAPPQGGVRDDSAVAAGAAVGLSYSLAYAPPEVVHAIEAAAPTLVASAAVDMWALGVIAFELLTQHHPFPPKATRASVRSQIAGRESLPWECKTDPQCARDLEMLRGLRRTVLKCLDRNPEKRPTAEALLSKWNHMFDQITSELTATGPVPGALAVPSVVPSPAAEAAAAAAAEAEAAEAVGPTAVASDAEAELAIAEAVARTSTPPPLLASPPQTVRPAAAPAADSSGGDDGAVVSPRPPLAESPSPRPQGESSGLAAASATMAALLTPAPSDGATPSSSASPSLVAPLTSAADVSHADGSEPAAPTTVQMKSSHDEERGQ